MTAQSYKNGSYVRAFKIRSDDAEDAEDAEDAVSEEMVQVGSVFWLLLRLRK